jgi:hypothetical protein
LRIPVINLLEREWLEVIVGDFEAAYLFGSLTFFSFRHICKLNSLGMLQLFKGDSAIARPYLAILVAPTRVHWGALAIPTKLTRAVLIIVALRRVGGIALGLGYQWVRFAYINRLRCSREESFHPVIEI